MLARLLASDSPRGSGRRDKVLFEIACLHHACIHTPDDAGTGGKRRIVTKNQNAKNRLREKAKSDGVSYTSALRVQRQAEASPGPIAFRPAPTRWRIGDSVEDLVIGSDPADVYFDCAMNPSLLIEGMPGSGKTELARTLVRDAIAAGSRAVVVTEFPDELVPAALNPEGIEGALDFTEALPSTLNESTVYVVELNRLGRHAHDHDQHWRGILDKLRSLMRTARALQSVIIVTANPAPYLKRHWFEGVIYMGDPRRWPAESIPEEFGRTSCGVIPNPVGFAAIIDEGEPVRLRLPAPLVPTFWDARD